MSREPTPPHQDDPLLDTPKAKCIQAAVTAVVISLAALFLSLPSGGM